jgi:hypothetical protein
MRLMPPRTLTPRLQLDDGSQDDDNASGAQVDGVREQGHRDEESAKGYYTNMHRAISGAI